MKKSQELRQELEEKPDDELRSLFDELDEKIEDRAGPVSQTMLLRCRKKAIVKSILKGRGTFGSSSRPKPDGAERVRCVLMKRRHGSQKFIERAREIIEEADSCQEIVDGLRGSMEAANRLCEEGWLPENTGVNVKGLRYWKKQRREAVDTHYFDYLLLDIIHAQVKFWQHYHGYEVEETFLEEASDGGIGTAGSEENMAKTFLWLRDEIEAPTELRDKQQTLEVVE